MTCVAQQFRAPLPLFLTLLCGREWLAYGLTKKHREDIYSHRREAEWLNMQLGKLYEGGGVPDLEYSWLRIDLIDSISFGPVARPVVCCKHPSASTLAFESHAHI